MGFTNLISKLFFPKNGTATRNSAKAIRTEGRCGEQIEWKFIPGERELRISGTGATYEFVRTKDVPWEAFVSQIQKISVEEGVTSLGSRLFRYCNILEEVSLPHSLRQIGQHCFAYCSNLASIHLPEGLSSIDKYAFSYCTSLQELTLPASLAQIRQSAFAHCSNLNNIHFLSETTEIGSSCFSGCTSLAGIRLPERLERINKNLFQDCASLTRIHIPQSVTTVEDEAFKDCHRLETIDLPATVHNIGKQVFSGCHSLTSLTLPFPGWGTPALAHQFCELFGTSPDKEMRLVTPNQGETTQNYYLPISLSVLHRGRMRNHSVKKPLRMLHAEKAAPPRNALPHWRLRILQLCRIDRHLLPWQRTGFRSGKRIQRHPQKRMPPVRARRMPGHL